MCCQYVLWACIGDLLSCVCCPSPIPDANRRWFVCPHPPPWVLATSPVESCTLTGGRPVCIGFCVRIPWPLALAITRVGFGCPGVYATQNHRRRWWGAPHCAADIIPHSTQYPRVVRDPTTSDPPMATMFGTFSNIAIRGRSSLMIRHISHHKPDRVSSLIIPRCLPAVLISWHGNPPHITSTGCKLCAPTSRTSLCIVALGQCLANMVWQNGFCSTCQTVVASPNARSKPSSNPPMPANKEPILIIDPHPPRFGLFGTVTEITAYLRDPAR